MAIGIGCFMCRDIQLDQRIGTQAGIDRRRGGRTIPFWLIPAFRTPSGKFAPVF